MTFSVAGGENGFPELPGFFATAADFFRSPLETHLSLTQVGRESLLNPYSQQRRMMRRLSLALFGLVAWGADPAFAADPSYTKDVKPFVQ